MGITPSIRILAAQPIILFSLILCLSPVPGSAQDDIKTDRPGFINSERLLAAGMLQVETGLRFRNDQVDTEGRVLAVESLLRFGATSWLEARFGNAQRVLRAQTGSTGDEPPSGWEDFEAGIKLRLLDIGQAAAALVLKTTLPSGSRTQTASGYEPGFELIASHKLNGQLALSGTVNLTRLKQEEGFVWQPAYALGLDRQQERLETFIEAFVLSPKDGRPGNQWMINGGAARVLLHWLSIDASLGHALTGRGEWFALAGLSLRLAR